MDAKVLSVESIAENKQPRTEIVTLNVGGRRFCTSWQTLTWIPDSFFTSLMSGRVPSLRDETGAIFIDRDPDAFVPILNYLRTKTLDFRNVDMRAVKNEAEFYGILPLVKRLTVCEELEKSSCGNILFYCLLRPSVFERTTELLPPSSNSLPAVKSTGTNQHVIQIVGHGNFIAVAYKHCVCVLSVKESLGCWEELFTTPVLEHVPQRIVLSARTASSSIVGPILAVVSGNEIKVWQCSATPRVLTTFDMKMPVDGLLFVGNQLAAITNSGKVAVWQSVQQHWQVQELSPICSYDMAGSYLLLGCADGNIYYIDMEKFPVRMKDNDILVTQLFEDPFKEPITALGIYLTPNVFPGSQTFLEVAYGTRAGSVRHIVRHPENIGRPPQIFQSYNVHTCPILRVVLGEKHLISVCAENHVRTWAVTRFRGRISTQPGSNPIASFKVMSLEGAHSLFYPINSIGPFGERDEEQLFLQRVIPETDRIFVRLSSNGRRVCTIDSIDGSHITAYCVHECEAVNRLGMRSKRFLFTGHMNGNVQVWDLSAALELSQKDPPQDKGDGGPTKAELLELLHNCDVSCGTSSMVSSRAPSPSPSLLNLIFPGYNKATPTTQQGGAPVSSTLSLSVSNIFRLAGDVDGVTASSSGLSLNVVAPPIFAREGLALDLTQRKPRLQAEIHDEESNLLSHVASAKVPPADEGAMPGLSMSRHGSPQQQQGLESRPASNNSDATPTPVGGGPSSSCSSPQRSSPILLPPPKDVDQFEHITDESTEC